MKKIITIFLAIILCLTLVACIGTPAEATDSANAYQMDKIAYFSDSELTIYREPVTDVLYMVYDKFNFGGVAVMLDPETGLPMTYTNYLAQYNEMFLG